MFDINKMTLKEKIGQIVHCGFSGPTSDENINNLIKEYHIGGVILFGRNITSSKQILELTQELQSYSKIPLLTGIDQEGGMVVRIEENFATAPGSMAIAATGKVEYAKKLAYNTGQQLVSLGINMNYAPCIDVNNNPLNPVIGVRAYGDQPEQVSLYGNKTIDGHRNAKVISVAKHFPGHGDTNVDSHLGMPVVSHSRERIDSVELVPFKRAIENNVDSIMISHVSFIAIDNSNIPATLSKKVVTDLLKEEMNYGGVAMTDCMEMKAIIDQYGMGEASVLAIEAGIDTVLISHTYKYQVEALESLYKACESGRISEKRLNDAVLRNLELKTKVDVPNLDISYEEATKFLEIEEKQSFVEKVSQESITMINSDSFKVLNSDDKVTVFWTDIKMWVEVDEMISQASTIGQLLKEEIKDINEFILKTNPLKEQQEEYLNKAKKSLEEDKDHKFIITTYNGTHNKGQINFVNEMLKLTDNVIVVALRNPYDILMIEDIKTYIIAYESKLKAIKSVVNILIGKEEATGVCPVELKY